MCARAMTVEVWSAMALDNSAGSAIVRAGCGNSLVATRVAARIGAALDTNIPVSMIFEASTVEKLAARAESLADRMEEQGGR